MTQPASDREPGTPHVIVSAQARDALGAAARRSTSKEHGGLLIGYRDGSSITIEDIIEIPDVTAGRTRYLRREHPARPALAAYLDRPGVGDTIGYVGEWHTHPAPVPPSPADKRAMRTMARKNRRPVALIVAALQADRCGVALHALISAPEKCRGLVRSQYKVAAIAIE